MEYDDDDVLAAWVLVWLRRRDLSLLQQLLLVVVSGQASVEWYRTIYFTVGSRSKQNWGGVLAYLVASVGLSLCFFFLRPVPANNGTTGTAFGLQLHTAGCVPVIFFFFFQIVNRLLSFTRDTP